MSPGPDSGQTGMTDTTSTQTQTHILGTGASAVQVILLLARHANGYLRQSRMVRRQHADI